MRRVHTTFVGSAQPYTHSDVPWLILEDRDALGPCETPERKSRWRLFHYLSGGGMRTFGRTLRQQRAEIRRNRFLVVATVLVVLWLAAFFV